MLPSQEVVLLAALLFDDAEAAPEPCPNEPAASTRETQLLESVPEPESRSTRALELPSAKVAATVWNFGAKKRPQTSEIVVPPPLKPAPAWAATIDSFRPRRADEPSGVQRSRSAPPESTEMRVEDGFEARTSIEGRGLPRPAPVPARDTTVDALPPVSGEHDFDDVSGVRRGSERPTPPPRVRARARRRESNRQRKGGGSLTTISEVEAMALLADTLERPEPPPDPCEDIEDDFETRSTDRLAPVRRIPETRLNEDTLPMVRREAVVPARPTPQHTSVWLWVLSAMVVVVAFTLTLLAIR
ncbi:MAG: hypothetical protein KC586_30610 [Myxococcales bacterium]|nr:hypothetical protein [Myxococcales bacterium]